MRRDRLGKILALIAGIGTLALILVVTIALYQLPRIGELRSNLIRRPTLAHPTRADVPLADLGPPQVAPSQRAVQSPPQVSLPPRGTNLLPPPQVQGDLQDSVVADYLVERFVEGPDVDVLVCENLASLAFAPPLNRDEFRNSLASQAVGLSGNNPFVESAIAPLGAVLQNPSVNQVVARIWQASTAQDESLLDRAEFYADVAMAAADVYAERAEIERMSQHAYHLYVMSRAVAAFPTLANESDFADLCTSVEGRLEAGTAVDEVSMEQEKEALLATLASYGIPPGQVGYDPYLPSTVQFDASFDRVVITSPWMNRQFGGGVSLSGQ